MQPGLGPGQIASVHQLYCQLTGQNLRLGFDRERQWFEWLRAGFTPQAGSLRRRPQHPARAPGTPPARRNQRRPRRCLRALQHIHQIKESLH
jgi:hypothetical protein